MSEFYDQTHRALQEEFQSTALADRLEQFIVKQHIDLDARDFIGRMPYCFLSTINESGFPTTSFKGGEPGFVKVAGDGELLMPCFDGNGMWLSAGNVASTGKVGLLFIDFESPKRLRIEGTACLSKDRSHLDQWSQAAMVIEISVTNIWVNCPRYIPTMTLQSASPDVPLAGFEVDEPDWKKMDGLADVVPPRPHTVAKK